MASRRGVLTVLILFLALGLAPALTAAQPPAARPQPLPDQEPPPTEDATAQARELAAEGAVPTVALPTSCTPEITVTANVVALDQPLFLNRLGANVPNAMIFALQGDVCPLGDASGCGDPAKLVAAVTPNAAGQIQGVTLRAGKRPRPVVLRVNTGQCLKVNFTNLLAPQVGSTSSTPCYQATSPVCASVGGPCCPAQSGQTAATACPTSGSNKNLCTMSPATPVTREASLHVQGVEWTVSPDGTPASANDGSWVGRNDSSLASPGQTKTYLLFASREGDFLLYSTGDSWNKPGGGGDGGQIRQGLFGAVNVQPSGAEWYRSQVTEQDLCLASKDRVYDAAKGCTRKKPRELPQIDYRAVYPAGHPRVGLPVLNMLNCKDQATKGCPQGGELVYSDLTAVITGRDDNGQPGRFPVTGLKRPVFNPGYSLPDRLQPYREFTIIYHEFFQAVQAFLGLYNSGTVGNNGPNTLVAGGDFFGINYGFGGIGSEILANRLGVGPMGNCPTCKYEEFFLASWVVGDPAMVVDKPADSSTCSGNTAATYKCSPKPGTEATLAYYPDDPSNVYHSYISDHTKFRIFHGGLDLHHLHHQHAHQWLHSPDSPNGDYTDSQAIGPGSSFTLEMVYNGSGNVNQTVGNSIFHCHFYPHFGAGMWSLWRVHDVFEAGTQLDAAGKPQAGSRALPDGEIVSGTPIPGLVPLPTLAMAPVPARVMLSADGTQAKICSDDGKKCVSPYESDVKLAKGLRNPGYPFFIPGLGGQRAPHPPLDLAPNPDKPGTFLDGGLPRHLVLPCPGGSQKDCAVIPDNVNYQDFGKELTKAIAFELPENGTAIERLAMDVHGKRFHLTATPEGKPDQFILNGLPSVPGAPYADPCIKYRREGGLIEPFVLRRYKAADIQLDVTFNKDGWHFPQQRMLALWGDVADTLSGKRAPEPLFFRSNSGECIEYTLANLVPNVYELDDFQVRTPTDILGQHIHLVKFDVTSSDGAGNGFNYEDGTFAPNEVVERISAINVGGGLKKTYKEAANPKSKGKTLAPKPLPFFGPGPAGTWMGAQATIQRWYADPLFDGPTHNPPAPLARDRTLRTVFTHDHFGPSTHQQAGLYAGLVIEPPDSKWFPNDQGANAPPFGGTENGKPILGPGRPVKGYSGKPVDDGGPTSWQAVIHTAELDESYREFLFEFQDTTLTYKPFAGVQPPALSQGFCSDTGEKCKPSTDDDFMSRNPDCNPDAVCYGYGYCHKSDATPVLPGKCVAESFKTLFCGDCTTGKCPKNPKLACDLFPQCPHDETCNRVAGIPNPTRAIDIQFATTGACAGNRTVNCSDNQDCTGLCQDNNGTLTCSVGGATCDVENKPCNVGVCLQDQFCNVTFTDPDGSEPYAPAPCPELITLASATNSFSVNYRNEPLFSRLTSPATGETYPPSLGNTGDLSFVYSSIPRKFCSDDLAPCASDADCSNDASCELGGRCADNYALCTETNTSLCQKLKLGGLRVLAAPPLLPLPAPSCSFDGPYEPLTPGVGPGDPFTPLLRAYAGDDVQVRTLIGAHINPHNFTIHDVKWLLEPSLIDSGWRNSQVMGISEHFEQLFQLPPWVTSQGSADYLYMNGAAAIEQAGGNWGLLRAYGTLQPDLKPLPQNSEPGGQAALPVCPKELKAPYQKRSYTVVALPVRQALQNSGKQLVYNSRTTSSVSPIVDPNAILYYKLEDLDCPNNQPSASCTARSDKPEPMVLRANAGDCIEVKLFNGLPAPTTGFCSDGVSCTYGSTCADGSSCQIYGYCSTDVTVDCTPATATNCPQPTTGSATCNAYLGTGVAGQITQVPWQSFTSLQVGLHPQLVTFQAGGGDGFNAGNNPQQTAAPGGTVTYTWYAGNIDPKKADPYIPIEFGASNLLPSDVLNHYQHGLFGGLVIEPEGATGWKPADGTTATIQTDEAWFREFVVVTQDGLQNPPSAVALGGNNLNAVNYRSELLLNGPRSCDNPITGDVSCFYSNSACCGTVSNGTCDTPCSDPQTPVFQACVGDPVRFRLLHPGGINTNQVFELYGHVWAETPYMSVGEACKPPFPTTHTDLEVSSMIGDVHQCFEQGIYQRGGDTLTDWQGSRMGHGPTNHFELLVKAGGNFGAPGDYLYRTYPAMHAKLGLWGILRVNQCPQSTGGAATSLPAAEPAAAKGGLKR